MERKFKSKFASLLAEPKRDDDANPSAISRRISVPFVPIAQHKITPVPQANLAYDHIADETIPTQNAAVSVKAELGVLSGLAKEELEALRKEFARAHHPDIHVGRSKSIAEEWMSIANQLLDEAMENL